MLMLRSVQQKILHTHASRQMLWGGLWHACGCLSEGPRECPRILLPCVLLPVELVTYWGIDRVSPVLSVDL